MAEHKVLRALFKDSALYGLGSLLAKSIQFFLLPIYTRIFSPAEFGSIEMLMIVAGLLGTVITMGLDSAQSHFFFKHPETGDRRAYVSAIFHWRLVHGIAIVAVATLLSPFINSWLFSGDLGWSHFLAAFSGALFFQVQNQAIELYRLSFRPLRLIIATLTHSILTGITTVILVIWLDQGILGYFLGYTITAIIIAPTIWYFHKSYLDFRRLYTELWPPLLRFGWPMLAGGILIYFMNSADRWFLQRLAGPETLGIYAVAARVSMIFLVIVMAFRKAWWPIAMHNLHSGGEPALFRLTGRLFLGLGSMAIIGLTLIGPFVIELIAPPVYHEAYVVIGPLAWHGLFYGFIQIGSIGIWKREKPKYHLYSIAVAAIANIGFNIWLVPLFGSLGAAVATSLAFFLWVVCALVVSESLWWVDFPLGLYAMQIAFGVAGCAIVLWLQISSAPWYEQFVAAVIASIPLLGTVIVGVFPAAQRAAPPR